MLIPLFDTKRDAACVTPVPDGSLNFYLFGMLYCTMHTYMLRRITGLLCALANTMRKLIHGLCALTQHKPETVTRPERFPARWLGLIFFHRRCSEQTWRTLRAWSRRMTSRK